MMASPTKKKNKGKGKKKGKQTIPVPTSGTASPEQVGAAMVQEGFPRQIDVVAEGIGIVMAESEGKLNAHNPTSCGSGYHAEGPWQICGPHFGKLLSLSEARDLLKSTNMAARIYKGAGNQWSDWATFHEGIGDSYTEEASAALGVTLSGKTTGDAVTQAAGAAIDPLAEVANAIKDGVKFLARLFEPEFWVRVGKAMLGTILLVFGMLTLLRAMMGIDLAGAAGRSARSLHGKASSWNVGRKVASGLSESKAAVESKSQPSWQTPLEDVPF